VKEPWWLFFRQTFNLSTISLFSNYLPSYYFSTTNYF